jgi:hypothetical protein
MNRTAQIFEAFAQRDEHLGYGYIGERRMALESVEEGEAGEALALQVRIADDAVLAFADEAGWSDEDLFAWANSKDGRWYADVMFGGSGVDLWQRAQRYVRLQRSI